MQGITVEEDDVDKHTYGKKFCVVIESDCRDIVADDTLEISLTAPDPNSLLAGMPGAGADRTKLGSFTVPLTAMQQRGEIKTPMKAAMLYLDGKHVTNVSFELAIVKETVQNDESSSAA